MKGRSVAQVRYWAAARDLAGTVTEPVDGCSVAMVLDAVGRRHGPRMVALLTRSVVLVDGAQASPADVVADASVLEVLPPYAGGSA